MSDENKIPLYLEYSGQTILNLPEVILPYIDYAIIGQLPQEQEFGASRETFDFTIPVYEENVKLYGNGSLLYSGFPFSFHRLFKKDDEGNYVAGGQTTIDLIRTGMSTTGKHTSTYAKHWKEIPLVYINGSSTPTGYLYKKDYPSIGHPWNGILLYGRNSLTIPFCEFNRNSSFDKSVDDCDDLSSWTLENPNGGNISLGGGGADKYIHINTAEFTGGTKAKVTTTANKWYTIVFPGGTYVYHTEVRFLISTLSKAPFTFYLKDSAGRTASWSLRHTATGFKDWKLRYQDTGVHEPGFDITNIIEAGITDLEPNKWYRINNIRSGTYHMYLTLQDRYIDWDDITQYQEGTSDFAYTPCWDSAKKYPIGFEPFPMSLSEVEPINSASNAPYMFPIYFDIVDESEGRDHHGIATLSAVNGTSTTNTARFDYNKGHPVTGYARGLGLPARSRRHLEEYWEYERDNEEDEWVQTEHIVYDEWEGWNEDELAFYNSVRLVRNTPDVTAIDTPIDQVDDNFFELPSTSDNASQNIVFFQTGENQYKVLVQGASYILAPLTDFTEEDAYGFPKEDITWTLDRDDYIAIEEEVAPNNLFKRVRKWHYFYYHYDITNHSTTFITKYKGKVGLDTEEIVMQGYLTIRSPKLYHEIRKYQI